MEKENRFFHQPRIEDPDKGVLVDNQQEDEAGIYRLDRDGNKWRQPVWQGTRLRFYNRQDAEDAAYHRQLQQHGLDPLRVLEDVPLYERHASREERRLGEQKSA